MMIALAILNFYDHGITRRDLRDLALELVRRNHQVVILSRSWYAEMLPGVQHVKLSAPGFGKIGKLISFGKKVRAYCHDQGVDLFVAFSRIPGADFYYLGEHELKQKKFRFGSLFSLSFWRKHFLEKRLFSAVSTTKILALVPSQIENLTQKFHTPKERLVLLPVGVSTECRSLKSAERDRFCQDFRKQYSISDQEKILLMVGSGFHSKGVDRAILAMSYLPGEALGKFRLVICGKGAISKLDALARRYNVKSRVVFAEQIWRAGLMSVADLVLCLPRYEQLDSTALESIACGTPVVVTELNKFSDWVEKSGGVILPEPFHSHVLTQFLHRIAVNPDFYDEMKRKIASQKTDELYHRVETMANLIEAAAR